jgi:pimeloyl-ACP methyl ester carboxylesterase
MKNVCLLICSYLFWLCPNFSQVTQFPQIYYNGSGTGGNSLLIRQNPSLGSTAVTSLPVSAKIGAESYTTSTESMGTVTWAKVCLPSTTGNIEYGYMLYGEYYIRINEINNYGSVTATSLFIRPCAGCTTSNVTIGGQNAKFGQNSIVSLTSNVTNISGTNWYEVYLPTNCSQPLGWVSGAFLSLNQNTTNYYNVGGKILNNNQQLVTGATVNFGSWNTNSSEGFYQYKLPIGWSGSITCIHPNYNTTSPASYSYTSNSHNYTKNFTLSNSAPCTPVSITTQPQNQTATAGSTATFSVVAAGTAPYSYFWYKNGVLISGANGSSYTTPVLTLGDNGSTYNCIILNCSNNSQVVSNTVTLTVTSACTPVSITTQPQNQTATAGSTATFSVVAAGTAPYSYFWYKNGVLISGANGSSYTTPVLTLGDNGSTYNCIILNCSNNSQVVSNTVTLTVTSACTPVSITTQPQNQTATAGSTATFSVVAAGTAPYSYFWYKNGVLISGANGSSYTTPVLTLGDNGSTYNCIILNCSNNSQVVSNTVTLTVTSACTPVSITTQPQNQTATAGSTATFSVVAAGTAPYSYFWYKNGVLISGANGSSYTTPVLTLGDNGSTYNCSLINCGGAGATVSNNAILNVTSNCITPSVQSSNILASSITTTQMTLTWTKGNGSKRIVVARKNGIINSIPTDGTIYTANAAFGNGSVIAPNEYVVYNGTGNTVTVTNLESNIGYYFKVFEYDCNPTKYLSSNETGNPLLHYTNANAPNFTQFVGTNVVPTHGINQEFYKYDGTSTKKEIKVCADGSKATYFKVKVDNTSGVSFRIKYNGDVVCTPTNTTDEYKYGKLFALNPFSTSLGNFVEINYLHPDHVSEGLYKPLTLEVTYNETNIAEFNLHIYRAPIVFVHGYKGKIETFYDLETDLLISNLYPKGPNSPLTYRVNYFSTSFQRFNTNRTEVAKGIDEVFRKARGDNFSCGKAIIIAHSMGGILSRLYLQSTYENVHYRFDIQKLLTLNTPHYGTQLATIGNKVYQYGQTIIKEEEIIRNYLKLIDIDIPTNAINNNFFGAIRDMSINSWALVNELNIPLSLQNKVPSVTLSSTYELNIYNPLYNPIITLLNQLPSLVYGESNDLIVPVTSQKGGINKIQSTNNQFHIGSSKNSEIKNKVIELINLNENDIIFNKTGFPPPPPGTYNPNIRNNLNENNRRAVLTDLAIIQPENNQIVSINDTVKIKLNLLGEFSKSNIIAYGESIKPEVLNFISLDSFVYIIPDNSRGHITFLALAGDSLGWKAIDEVDVFVQSYTTFDSINIELDTIYLPLGSSIHIEPTGYFDGKSIPISILNFPFLEIVYDTSIINFTQNVFYGEAPGTSYIKFTYQQISDSVFVNVTNDTTALLASFDYNTETICKESFIQFRDESRGLAQSYQWTFEGGVPNTSTENNPKVFYSYPGKYSVKLKTTFVNGVDSFKIDSLITVLPRPSASISSSLPLEFCEGEHTTLSITSNANQFEWSSFDTTQTIDVYYSGNYYAIITDTNGCTAMSDTVHIEVLDLPINFLDPGTSSICSGDSTMITSMHFEKYLWNNGDTTQSITVFDDKDYFVMVTDSNGCTAMSDTVHIEVLDLPINFLDPGTSSICSGDSTMITSMHFEKYLWNNGDTTQSITVFDDKDYFVMVTDSNGCTAMSDTVHIEVLDLPINFLDPGTSSICSGDSTMITSMHFEKYLWNNGDTTQSITVFDDKDYFVMVTDSNGCTAMSDLISITVNQLPNTSIFALQPTTFCYGDSVILVADPQFNNFWNNGLESDSLTVYQSGDYFVVSIDSNGCANISLPINITVNDTLSVNITLNGDEEICQGEKVILTSDVEGIHYLWNTSETTKSISVDTQGVYFVSVTNEYGCISRSNEVEILLIDLPKVVIDTFGLTKFCEGDSVKLYVNEANTYHWNTDQNTRGITVYNTGDFQVTISDSNGCVNTSGSVHIDVLPRPSAVIEPFGYVEICEDKQLFITSFGGNSNIWNSGQTANEIFVNLPGKYWVTVTDSNGCIDISDTLTLVVNPLPKVSIELNGPTDFCSGDSLVLSTNGAQFYNWSNGSSSPSIKISESGSFFSYNN